MISLLFLLAVVGGEGMFALTGFIPPEDRLMPYLVVLEHRFLGPDDETWETGRTGIGDLSPLWGDGMREMGFGEPWCAPVPLTRDQALSGLPGASELADGSVMSVCGEHTLTYGFDGLNRTVAVDWDPVADSGVYTFLYSYDDPEGSGRPVWIIPEDWE